MMSMPSLFSFGSYICNYYVHTRRPHFEQILRIFSIIVSTETEFSWDTLVLVTTRPPQPSVRVCDLSPKLFIALLSNLVQSLT